MTSLISPEQVKFLAPPKVGEGSVLISVPRRPPGLASLRFNTAVRGGGDVPPAPVSFGARWAEVAIKGIITRAGELAEAETN